ncbi:MAG TPA: amidophosphoribosyltransferase [Alphaproteobacteria bacterium]|nr:amidophosphoribosyltransferase [Alphaproteobacteria bacterium]HIK87228.1 amidophosphoribosyltransferase [Alphaproteobacteria bacterium]
MYDDKLKEECGIFGVFGHPDAAALTALGMHALQHRGQESAGIVSFDGKHFNNEPYLGLVGDHFTKASVIDKLPGNSALGHVRYSTTGNTSLKNIQPLFADLIGGGIACAHNGNLTNGIELRNNLVKKGAIFQSTTDTEALLHLIAQSNKTTIIKKIIDALFELEGAYSIGLLTNKKLIAIKDPLGIRPLVLGELNGAIIISSETCALDIIGANYTRDIDNGEVVVIDNNGIKSYKPFPKVKAKPCIFEYIYFARPDSIIGGKNVYDCRKKMGKQLAKELKTDADIVIPVPDSGVPAALGYAEASNIPYNLGIIRNHYVGRTFIEPIQTIRQLGIKLKHNTNKILIENKKVVLIDDSIVRGTTAIKIVEMMRNAGALEVHMRISSPPIKFPDFYGIDTPNPSELIASSKSVEEIKNLLKLDSLHFLSLDGLYKSMGHECRDNINPQYTDHCFTGEYPTKLADRDEGALANQLSLLNDQ